MMRIYLEFLSLTPGFSRVNGSIPHHETVLTVWMRGGKPLKRFHPVLHTDTWLKPGANENLISF
jgi:hypothetical protein